MNDTERVNKNIVKIVVNKTAENFGVDANDIWTNKKSQMVVVARYTVVYICYELFGIPMEFISHVLRIKTKVCFKKALANIIDTDRVNYSLTIDYFRKYIERNEREQ